MIKIKLTDKQSTSLFNYPNKQLRIKRYNKIYYISKINGKYRLIDWTGKSYKNIIIKGILD